MVDSVSISLEGASELDKKLRELEPKVAKKHLRRVLRLAGKMVLAATKARAPVKTGLLKSALTLKAIRSKGQNRKTVGVRIGVVADARFVSYERGASSDISILGKTRGRRYFYPAAVEYGTRHKAASPFMRPAFDATKLAALNMVMRELKVAVEREAAK